MYNEDEDNKAAAFDIVFMLAMVDQEWGTEHDHLLVDTAIERAKILYNKMKQEGETSV